MVAFEIDTREGTDSLHLLPTSNRVGRWWQKVVLTTGFLPVKTGWQKMWWQEVAKNKINLIIKGFLIFLDQYWP